MLWEKIEETASRIRRAAERSEWATLAVQKVPWQSSQIAKTDAKRRMFYRKVLREGEQSLFLSSVRRVSSFLLRTDVSSYAVFLLVWAVVCVCCDLLTDHFSFFSVRFLLPVLSAASAIPLLPSAQPLSAAIRNSRILHWFLFDFCRLSESGFLQTETGMEARLLPIFSGLAAGLFSGFWHPAIFFFGSIILLALTFFAAVPEPLLLLLLLLLPLFGSMEHSSIFLAVAAGISLLTYLRKALTGKRQTELDFADLMVLLFALLTLFGGFGSAGDRRAILSALLASLLTVAGWFPVRGMLVNPLWRSRAVFCLSFSGALLSGAGIFQYVSGNAVLRWVDLSRFSDLGGRVTVGFGNPNLLAIYLLVVFPLSYGELFSGGFLRRFFFALFTVLSGGCLILTWSRGAWLGAALGVLLFLLLFSTQTMATLPLLPIAAAGASPFLPGTVLRRLFSIGNLRESSVRYRLESWQGIFRMIAAHPFGIGMGEEQFHAVFSTFAVSGTETLMHAHNVFLQILVTIGLPGLAIFLLLLLLLTVRLIAGCGSVRRREDRARMLAAGSAIAGLLLMGFFDHLWYNSVNRYLFWLAAAWFAVQTEPGEKEGKDEITNEIAIA